MTKRVRLPHSVPHELRRLLVRVARVNAQAANCRKVYVNPEGVGGGLDADGEDNNFVLRAKRGCRTILHDFLTAAIDEIDDICAELDAMNERDACGEETVNGRTGYSAGRQKK